MRRLAMMVVGWGREWDGGDIVERGLVGGSI